MLKRLSNYYRNMKRESELDKLAYSFRDSEFPNESVEYVRALLSQKLHSV